MMTQKKVSLHMHFNSSFVLSLVTPHVDFDVDRDISGTILFTRQWGPPVAYYRPVCLIF